GNADLFPGRKEPRHHARSGQRRSRALWSLNGQDAAIDLQNETPGFIDDVRADGRQIHARWTPQEQVASRTVTPRPVDTVIGDPRPNAVKRLGLVGSAINLMSENRGGMKLRSVSSLLDVDRSRGAIDGVNTAKFCS